MPNNNTADATNGVVETALKRNDSCFSESKAIPERPNVVSELGGALKDFLETYADINADRVDEMSGSISAVEFMRFVALNRPVVVRQFAKDWDPVRLWSGEYLERELGDIPVKVAITPRGNADAVLEKGDGSLSFIEPHEETRPFKEVLRYIQAQASERDPEGPIWYCQSQNDNLSEEYVTLKECGVPDSIDFARIALGQSPEAVNFWLGNSHSTTSLHKDPYENIYVQVRGQKHFVLLPPVALPGVNEQELVHERYVPEDNGNLQAQRSQPAATLPVATWDPDEPTKRPSEYSSIISPITVTLQEGDILYLPAMWYHKVKQSCGKDGFCCALNYWYDMDLRGPLWSTTTLLRNLTRLTQG